MNNILINGLDKLLPSLSNEQREIIAQKMELYIKEIILFNSAYNLTNTSDHDELVIRHILDSLAGFNIIKNRADQIENVSIGDIGSGGGLPGIPLASAFLYSSGSEQDSNNNVHFKLVERMEKRCSFLENCCSMLGLTNTEICNLQAEQVEPESFDIITFRAFRPLDEKMTKTLLRMVKKGGVLCAYKARLENIHQEMDGIKKLVTDYEVLPLSVPGLEDSERNMVVIKK